MMNTIDLIEIVANVSVRFFLVCLILNVAFAVFYAWADATSWGRYYVPVLLRRTISALSFCKSVASVALAITFAVLCLVAIAYLLAGGVIIGGFTC